MQINTEVSRDESQYAQAPNSATIPKSPLSVGLLRNVNQQSSESQTKVKKDNWQSFIQKKIEKKNTFHGTASFGPNSVKAKKDLERAVNEDLSENTSESLVDMESDQTNSASPEKRIPKLDQEDMIIVCTTDSDRQILPDRPVSFTNLDYRLDIKTDLFTEREIQIISNAVEMEAHIICLSCVESVEDVREARRVLKTARGHHLQIYSKI